MKVYLSPSSQTENVGVNDYGTEASPMQQLSDKVKTKLTNKGHSVYGSDNSLSLTQRITASNNAGVACHVALHSNAGGGTGPDVWYYSTSSNGKRLAENILAEIVEVAFHDNANDAAWIINNMDAIAQAIADGIDYKQGIRYGCNFINLYILSPHNFM